MTPAINSIKEAHVAFTVHQYEHDPASPSYGEEAASKLGVDPARVFKTLVVAVDGGKACSNPAVAVIPVTRQLNLKGFAKAITAKKCIMAERKLVERATGYVPGGVSPVGQRKKLTTVIDDSALTFPTIYVSAGRRGLEVELAAADLKDLTAGLFAPIGQ